jgi:antitoxin ParD1/3/4/toxin ParE1/3/4
LREFTAAFRLLAAHPDIGHFRRDLTPLPVKFWTIFSYLVVYDHAARPAAIARVLRGSRDVAAVLNRQRGW